MDWTMGEQAKKICERLGPSALPHEILRLEDATAGIVFDLDGVDYILTVQCVPKQRERSVSN